MEIVQTNNQTSIKFMKFSNMNEIMKVIATAQHKDILEKFLQLDIDEKYAFEVIKLLAKIKDRLLVGVLYHAAINEIIIQKEKRIEIIEALSHAIGGRQAYEAEEFILKCNYDDNLSLKIIKIIVKSKNEFTANAAKKIALNDNFIKHKKAFEILEIVTQMENSVSDLFHVVKFVTDSLFLEQENVESILKQYIRIGRNRRFMVSNIMFFSTKEEEISTLISFVADYKSLTKLIGINENLFENRGYFVTESRRKTIFETIDYFKDYEDNYSLFSCVELFKDKIDFKSTMENNSEKTLDCSVKEMKKTFE